ncbi:MAG: hypothetical protein KAX80_10785 [Planctomycetes bacterium]|nr:hypothetical protein [Planctomycetota bacterium]
MHLPRLSPVGAAALALLLAATLPGEVSAPDPGPAFSPSACASGELGIESGVPVLQVAGSPRVLGEAYGRLVGEQMRYLRVHYLERVLGAGRLKQLALEMARPMERHIPERYLRELGALAEAAGASREDVLLLATFLDVYRLVGCSTVVAVPPAAAGRPLLARNLDFPTLGVTHRYSMVAVYHPEGFRSFLSVTWPGLPGVVSGMNQAGLVLVMSEVSDREQSLDGIPYQLLYRRALEECDTVEQAEELIRRAPRTMANNVVLLDGGGHAAVLEVTRSAVVRRELQGGVLCATNHFRGRGGGGVRPCRRYDILGRELARLHGRLGVTQAVELLGMVHQGPLTMQSMIFEPGAMRVHLALGLPPTTSGPYRTLDAGRLFRWQPSERARQGAKVDGDTN